jgi:polyhydroxybutyrate depolymerase
MPATFDDELVKRRWRERTPHLCSAAMRAILVPLFCIAAVACHGSSSSAPSPDAGDEGDLDAGGITIGGDRPVTVRVPAGYDPSKPAPLVMMLHGYGSANILTEDYFAMSSLADEHGFFYVAPNGTFDSTDHRFWNATDACCDFDHTGIDDSGYLASLITQTQAAYNIDPARIYVMGHSNGGYMSHRLACDHADVFAAIASYAGAVWSDPTKCNPSGPIAILQAHGTADTEVLYGGDEPDSGSLPTGVYPGAVETMAIWATKNGCDPALNPTGVTMHVDTDGTGNETTVSSHTGCPGNSAAELWTIQGAPHVFVWTHDGLEAVWSFFAAHPKSK